jgi:glutamate 5-kinase
MSNCIVSKISKSRRIVIKIGSSLLVNKADLKFRSSWLDDFVQDISTIICAGNSEVIIVSSGSIALAKSHIAKYRDHDIKNLPLPVKQALACFGQPFLMQKYAKAFAKVNLYVGQLLLTLDDTQDATRSDNASNTIDNLLANNIIPIINENDAIATEEIKYGDNDRLSARFAEMVGADLLILLSDVDGLYDKNPNLHQDAKLIRQQNGWNDELLNIAGDSVSSIGTGGMQTKMLAVRRCLKANCQVIITNGINHHPLTQNKLFSSFNHC